MNTPQPPITLIGAPVQAGAGRQGCIMGPAALRVAGLGEAIAALGLKVEDRGDLIPEGVENFTLAGKANHAPEIAGWSRALERAAFEIAGAGDFPIFLGGDHSLSMGSVSGLARHAAARERPLFVLWLDAHADFNTPETSPSGNMHGMPLAFFCGEPGFDGLFEGNRAVVSPERVFVFGVRSIDADERDLLAARGVNVFDMRAIDEFGTPALIRQVLEQVDAADGLLHISLDVDFLDPAIAPGGGATFRESHLVMEMLCDSGRATSLDLVELNPFLDDRGMSARMLVELTASLFGRRIFERPTRPA